MQDRPDLKELLDAVAAFLRSEVMPGLEGRQRYHLLVALNLLGIAGREWALAPEQAGREAVSLADVLEGSPGGKQDAEALRAGNGELCAAIRAGRFDAGENRARLLAHLREVTADKLRIANPDFLARVRAE